LAQTTIRAWAIARIFAKNCIRPELEGDSMFRKAFVCALLAGSSLVATDAFAATAQEQRQQKQAEIPRCAAPLGVAAWEWWHRHATS